MVEAREDVSMSGTSNDEMQVDEVYKPRNTFSSNALRRAVPQTDLQKKKASLSMSMINMGASGRLGSRMFSNSNLDGSGGEQGRHLSFNIAKQISFTSPSGKKFGSAPKKNGVSGSLGDSRNQEIAEVSGDDCDSSDSSVKSDPSSSSGDSSDSIEAAINGDDNEDAIYDQILAAQEGRKLGGEEKKDGEVQDLVDRNMINLLRVCSMLQRPTPEQIEERKVNLGPQEKSKLLILDMDETLLHSKFHKLTGTEDFSNMSTGIEADEKGVMQFNILISSKPE